MKSLKRFLLCGLVLSPLAMFAQSAPTVDVSAATGAISAAQTAGGTVITAGLAFAGIWVGYKYAKRVFGKA